MIDTISSFIEIRSREHNQILGNDSTLCQGESINLEVESECGGVVWQDGSNSLNYEITEAGEYSVGLIANGCWATDTIFVSIIDLPQINLGNDTALCIGESIDLISDEGLSYIWQNQTSDSIYTVTTSGQYYASISKEHCIVSDTISIEFEYCANPSFDLPNIFTPNGDGKNDVFEIVLPPFISFIELSIFNRWGNEVFRSTNQSIEWVGSGFSEGTYFWVLYYADIRARRYTKSGSVELKR
jgi:gliding motility-associated-like protein